ncbi:MAG: antitoxin component YwqK of YwqJK toxin-antitoxin module [Flavobacterium sp.]|jgi:antitoxin component YwqK of YwqJK toxin-antitoxin module
MKIKVNKMFKKFHLYLLLAVSVLLSSCQKDDDVPPPQTDYSIESSTSFEVISQYPNGWIKEARSYKYGGDGELVPSEEWEYYENGNIKTAKLYAFYVLQRHLYMEVSRSEDNKPLWSKYYTREGDLWIETDYVNGLPSVKKVYSEEGTAIHYYTNGDLSSIEFTTADNRGTSTTTYNRDAGIKKLSIAQDGKTVLEEEYPYLENYGDGVLTSNQVPLANPFTDTEESYVSIADSDFNMRPNQFWKDYSDPGDLLDPITPYRVYYELYQPHNKFATRFVVNSELYQSIIEQYPVTEDEVLISRYSYKEGMGRFSLSQEERKSLNEEMEQNPSLFELKYGNEYLKNIFYGKNLFIIGAIRNLPTDTNAAKDVKKLAYKQMKFVLTGKNQLSTEEHEILDKVWFEVKFFSTLKMHRNGVVLNSSVDYDAAMEEVKQAESSVLQLQYTPFSHLVPNE